MHTCVYILPHNNLQIQHGEKKHASDLEGRGGEERRGERKGVEKCLGKGMELGSEKGRTEGLLPSNVEKEICLLISNLHSAEGKKTSNHQCLENMPNRGVLSSLHGRNNIMHFPL